MTKQFFNMIASKDGTACILLYGAIGSWDDADVRSGDDPREAQRRLIRDGEAMAVENRLQLNDEPEENQPDSGEEE